MEPRATRRAPAAAGALLLSVLFFLPSGVAQGACDPDVSVLQVVGDFNGWDPFVPLMSELSPCVWADTVAITAGCSFLKFRTDLNWDYPPDLGRCSGVEGPCQVPVPADGTPVSQTVCPVTGTGTALGELEFPLTGLYEFVVELAGSGSQRVCTVRLLEETPVPGSISGAVAYSDNPPGTVFTVVSVFEAGTTDLVTFVFVDPVTRTFHVPGIVPGTYDLLLEAPGYEPEAVPGIVVLPGEDTDVGTVVLTWLCIPFSQIQVVGDFNGWDENAPPMTQVASCAWADTLDLPVTCSFVKFRTDGDWDPTPDWGRCTGVEGICQLPVPADGSVLTEDTCLVTGLGTAIGQLEITEAGRYEFVLDTGVSTYSVRFLDGAVSVRADSWGQVKARYRD